MLLPTDGRPTSPTSARSFNSNFKYLVSPGSPFSENVGQGLLLVLKAVLPRPPLPPLAIIISESFSFKSQITLLVSRSVTTVPWGTLITISLAALPCLFLPSPFSPLITGYYIIFLLFLLSSFISFFFKR